MSKESKASEAAVRVESRPLGLRIWHWGSGLTVLLILGTVVLRKTFLSARSMSAVMSAELSKGGIAVPEETAKAAARAIRDGMWEWHYKLGFVLAGWFWVRWMFGKFPFPKPNTLKNALHAAFYAATAFMAVSGLLMYFSGDLHIPDGWVDDIHEIHEAGQWFFFVFLPLHLIGVVRAELRGERGIVSRMIHGGD